MALRQRCWLVALASLALLPSSSIAQRVPESRFRGPQRLSAAPAVPRLLADTAKRPNGMQIGAGYMGAVLLGFLAWRAFDEPSGHHTKVKDDWGYTPRAHTALGIGSFVGATLAVWGSGRRYGAKGSLLGTALGAAVPTIPILLRRDDPLLPFMAAIFGAPAQGALGYVGYRASARK